jgi:hypothetical protein
LVATIAGRPNPGRLEVVDTLSEQKTLAREPLDLVTLKHRFQERKGG